jgi:hypothetical protein
MANLRRAKYGNRKVTTPDGLTFDSQKEYRRWCELRMLEKAGKIGALVRQVPFDLTVTCVKTGERKLVGRWKADFCYVDHETGGPIAEDVKGGNATKTPLYRWKAKHFEAQYGRKILET